MTRLVTPLLLLAFGLSTAGCPAKTKTAANSPAKTAATTKKPDGAAVFKQVCAVCHGPEGKGMPNLGKDMTSSKFIKTKTDEELVAFVKEGRAADHPLNTTKVAMPPRGGREDLLKTDADILAVVKFVRTLVKP